MIPAPLRLGEFPSSRRGRALLFGAAALGWLAVVLVTSASHEFFRDEVRAYSIAIAAPSLRALPALLGNEGHPILWYALLNLGHRLVASPLVLPATSLLVAGAAVALFLLRSPFPPLLKVLFVFGVLPLYEYSVTARNYGIGMLLMFAFAALFPFRRRHPLALALVLALLANANVHSLLISGVLTALWLWEEVVRAPGRLEERRLAWLGLGAGLVAAAALLSITTAWPDSRTIVTSVHRADLPSILSSLGRLVHRPWETMGELIPFPDTRVWPLPGWPWRALQTAVALLLLLGLAPHPRLAVAMLAAFLGLGFFFSFGFEGDLRHRGLLLVLLVTLYWLSLDAGPGPPGRVPARLASLAFLAAWPLVLLWNDGFALFKVESDIRNELSSVPAFGRWLSGHPEHRNSIVLGEPDYLLEALPYYAPQRVYIPREARFGKWVRFTTESKAVLGLGELLDAARELSRKEHGQVLIALGIPAVELGRTRSYRYSYNKVLEWTPEERERFRQGTTHVAGFWSPTTDENFDIYSVRRTE